MTSARGNPRSRRRSSAAAELVLNLLADRKLAEARGVRQAGFAVLKSYQVPSILVEIGYATNPADARMMSSNSGQQRIAEAIAGAIVNYLKWYDRLTADSSATDQE